MYNLVLLQVEQELIQKLQDLRALQLVEQELALQVHQVLREEQQYNLEHQDLQVAIGHQVHRGLHIENRALRQVVLVQVEVAHTIAVAHTIVVDQHQVDLQAV